MIFNNYVAALLLPVGVHRVQVELHRDHGDIIVRMVDGSLARIAPGPLQRGLQEHLALGATYTIRVSERRGLTLYAIVGEP